MPPHAQLQWLADMRTERPYEALHACLNLAAICCTSPSKGVSCAGSYPIGSSAGGHLRTTSRDGGTVYQHSYGLSGQSPAMSELTYDDITSTQASPRSWRASCNLRHQDPSLNIWEGCVTRAQLCGCGSTQLEHFDANVRPHHMPLLLQLQPSPSSISACG